MIKYSKELNKLLNKFLETEDHGDYLDDLMSSADTFCFNDMKQNRASDCAEYVDNGIEMERKSKETGMPIYCVHTDGNKENMLFYFVSDLDSVKEMFKELIVKNTADFEVAEEKYEEETIKALEKQLEKLKKKKGKKK